MHTISVPLSDRGEKNNSVTIRGIINELSNNSFPVVYIESDRSISVRNGILSIDGEKTILFNKSIIEIVKVLQDNDINAFLCAKKYEMLPSILLVEFESEGFLNIEANQSPVNITQHHDSYIDNIVNLEHANITKEVVSVYDNTIGNKFTTNDQDDYFYNQKGDLVYINNITPSTEILTKYSVGRYFLLASEETVVELYDLVKEIDNQGFLDNSTEELLALVNKLNKDMP